MHVFVSVYPQKLEVSRGVLVSLPLTFSDVVFTEPGFLLSLPPQYWGYRHSIKFSCGHGGSNLDPHVYMLYLQLFPQPLALVTFHNEEVCPLKVLQLSAQS